MENIFNAVKDNALFRHISQNDFDKTLCCLSAKTASYKKNDIIIPAGEAPKFIGLVLNGKVRIVKEDMDGKQIILGDITPPNLFGETYAWAGADEFPVTVQAAGDCDVLLIDFRKIINACSSACAAHRLLIENMLQIMASKISMLDHKVEILSKRTIRERLTCFLKTHAKGVKKFAIPFNREEMAQFLCVDRSALSNELSKMRDEGLIIFNRNKFEWLHMK
ncbi:MAG: Crp/Fnr family transcriptional regulator [Defluviitaleaceae bacterium]|nr:Crp/Fnr family transcriptional regulator [Defluviitaleaceae bacterium]